jgi:hypothetical protein
VSCSPTYSGEKDPFQNYVFLAQKAKFKSEHIRGFRSGVKNALRYVAVVSKYSAVAPTLILFYPEFEKSFISLFGSLES